MGYDPVSLEILDPIHIQDRQKLALFFINLVMISEHNHVTPDKISHTFILKCSVVISARHYIYLNLWGSQFLSSRNTIQLVMFPGGELSKSKRRLAIPGSVVFFTKIHNSMNPWFSGLQLDRFIIQFRIPSSLILLIELMFNTRISSMNFVRSRFSDISLRARRSKTLNSLVIISSLCPETSQASSSIPMPETIRKITLLGIEWYIHLDRTIPLPLQHRLILSSAFEKMDALAFLIKDALISEIQTAYRQKISGKIGRPKYFDHAIFHVFLSIEMSHYCHVLWINNFFSVDPVDFTIANQISCRGSLSGANKNPSEAIHCTMSSNAYTRKNFNVTINSSSGDKLHTEAYDKNQLSKLSHKNTRTIKAPVKSPHFSSKKRAPKKKDKPRVSVGLTKLYSVISTPTQVFQPLKPNTKFPKNCRVGATIFRIPFPPLSDSYFGLIHEKLADDPFRLLIAVAFLNRTHGKAAIPVFYELMARYPTPESLLVARKEEIITLIRHLGLQNQRASTYLAYASTWLENPPVKEKRYAVRGYPYPDSGRDIKKGEILTYSDKREAWEIGHMTLGAYALDSWRIFCRDKLRGVAAGWNGEGAEKGFQPEWMRVLPQDKELKAFLQWMWLKEGFEWDSSTGEKEVARIELMRAALEGNIVWDDIGGMRVRYKGT